MLLVNLLETKLIYFEQQPLSKSELIRDLTQRVCAHFELTDCGPKLYELVMQREAEVSTVYPTGLAIPHVRVDGYEDTVIGICIPRHPVIDNDIPVRIFVLIITGKTSSKLYLNAVSAFMRISKDPDLMQQILHEKDGNGVMQVLKKANIQVSEELSIRDIMPPQPIVIQSTATLKELGNLFAGEKVSYLPVVNERGILLGEVTLLNYLKIGVPDYMMRMSNLNFLHSVEPFEELYASEENLLVREIMTESEISVTPSSSIIEAVFEMIQHNKRVLPVVENKKVVSVISAMDIFKKVVRG